MIMFDDEIGGKTALIRKARNVSAKDLSIAIGKKSDYIHRIKRDILNLRQRRFSTYVNI